MRPWSAPDRSADGRPAGVIRYSRGGSCVDISRTCGRALPQPGQVTSPAPAHRPARPWQVALRTVWLALAALVAAVGTSAAFVRPGPVVACVVAGMLGLVAGGFTFAFGREDMTGLWRALRVGAWIAGTTVVAIGLGRLVGAWSALVLGLLVLSSPLVPMILRSFRNRKTGDLDPEPERERRPDARDVPVVVVEQTHGQVDMTEFEIALLDTEEEPITDAPPEEEAPLAGLDLDDLCRLWRRTSVLLRQKLDSRRLAEVLDARQHCLDELLRRDPAGTRAWLDAAGTRADDPRPFLTEEPESI